LERIRVERLDPLGIIAGVIKDLGIIEAIDERIPTDNREEITTGEAIAGMIINGLGFSNRPMTLTPQFFENKPLEILFRPEVTSEHFNRLKLGRSLDRIYNYGCDLLFSEVAKNVIEPEGVSLRFNCLDTTRFSLTGKYDSSSDEPAMVLTHGLSSDHRPDLKQAILELMVSQDGGVPFLSKSWDGNTSDNEVFQARRKELIFQFAASPTPRYLIADSKLSTEENAASLARLPFITRVPATLKVEQQLIAQAFEIERWQQLNDTTRFTRVEICHYGIEQRWLVVYSQAPKKRGEKTIAKAKAKEKKTGDKQLFHLAAKRFNSPKEGLAVLEEIVSSLKNSTGPEEEVRPLGKPTADTPVKAIQWQSVAQRVPDWQRIQTQQQQNACLVLATNIPVSQLTDDAVIAAYKGQGAVERGFGFLKAPLFFVSSLFLKKPSRIQGLLMVMT
jgi:transposase